MRLDAEQPTTRVSDTATGARRPAALRERFDLAEVFCISTAQLGKTSSAYDMLIGVHRPSVDLMLVTNNVREIRRIPGLRIDN